MRTFKLNKDWSIVCESKGTRTGFCHTGIIMSGGYERGRVRQSWCNRTWEMYEYQKLLERAMDHIEKACRVTKNSATRIRNKIKTGKFTS